jgi:hypothetical protein
MMASERGSFTMKQQKNQLPELGGATTTDSVLISKRGLKSDAWHKIELAEQVAMTYE